MLRPLLSLLCLLTVQAFDFADVLKAPPLLLRAAHSHASGIYANVIPLDDVLRIQAYYKAHPPPQTNKTDREWSVHDAFKFLYRNHKHFESVSIEAQPDGFTANGTLHQKHFNIKCTDKCYVQRTQHDASKYLRATTNCHPADSVVRVQHPCDAGMCVSPRRMDELKIGDLAEYDYGKFEPIIAFAHKTNAMNHYFRLIGGSNTLDISPKHYLYANGQEILPSNIKVGDTLSDGTQVSRIEHVYKKGAYHPHTASWTLIVNNLKTSQNTFVMKNEHLNDALQYIMQSKFSVLYALGVPEDRIDGSMWWHWQSNLKTTLESLPTWFLDCHWVMLPVAVVLTTVYTLPELMWGAVAQFAVLYYLSPKYKQ